jgi:tetratricopeptide (TPR) repeat protein
VRYVLQGSVRRAGDRVRVNTQLIDAQTDAHVWAERLDHAADDLFVLQDEVTSRIAIALNIEMAIAEAARPADRPDAIDFILRGRAALYNPNGATRENLTAAIPLFERSLELAPASADARALLALALVARVFEQMTDSAAADIERAEHLAREALAAAPRRSLVRYAMGQVLRAQNWFEAAIPEYETAIALDRNAVLALGALGQCKFFTGQMEDVIPAQERAIRLSPRDPYVANWYWRVGMVHLLQSRSDEAILWLEKARSANPRAAGPHAWLASAHALRGELDPATAELAEAQRLSGDYRYASIARHKSIQSLGSPTTHALAETTFYAGLRQAGVPEE